MESVFHELAIQKGLIADFMEIDVQEPQDLVFKAEGKPIISCKKGYYWTHGLSLCKPKRCVQGRIVTEVVWDCYFLPLRSSQPLYDAVILPDRSSDDPIDIVQVTTATEHSVVIREFANLFDLGASREQDRERREQERAPRRRGRALREQGRAPKEQERKPVYRFLMVRVALNDADAKNMRENPLIWNFVNPSKPNVLHSLKDHGFPGKIRFYECVWNLERALIAYVTKGQVKPSG
jgi:hypothetical protein